MRSILLPVLALLLAPALHAQPAYEAPPIRAWLGPSLMFASDLGDGIGAGYDVRVTIERPDLVGVTVMLGGYDGINEARNRQTSLYGAMLVGRSFPVAADAFFHLSTGVGYAEASRRQTTGYVPCDPYTTSCYNSDQTETSIGGIVPVRAELHVPYRGDRSFGISAQAMLFGDVPNRFGLGLHYSFGRNL